MPPFWLFAQAGGNNNNGGGGLGGALRGGIIGGIAGAVVATVFIIGRAIARANTAKKEGDAPNSETESPKKKRRPPATDDYDIRR